MAVYNITKGPFQITINDFVDTIPGQYKLEVDPFNQRVILKAEDGSYQTEINVGSDTVNINGVAFSGDAAALRTALLESIFSQSTDFSGLLLANKGVKFQNVAVASIGAASVGAGVVRYATNGLKAGETTGAGTGVLVYSDGTNWRRISDNVILSA